MVSPSVRVTWPTRTPATSVMALSAPGGKTPGARPRSRARGRPVCAWSTTARTRAGNKARVEVERFISCHATSVAAQKLRSIGNLGRGCPLSPHRAAFAVTGCFPIELDVRLELPVVFMEPLNFLGQGFHQIDQPVVLVERPQH